MKKNGFWWIRRRKVCGKKVWLFWCGNRSASMVCWGWRVLARCEWHVFGESICVVWWERQGCVVGLGSMVVVVLLLLQLLSVVRLSIIHNHGFLFSSIIIMQSEAMVFSLLLHPSYSSLLPNHFFFSHYLSFINQKLINNTLVINYYLPRV